MKRYENIGAWCVVNQLINCRKFYQNTIVNDEKDVDIIFRYNGQYKIEEKYLKN